MRKYYIFWLLIFILQFSVFTQTSYRFSKIQIFVPDKITLNKIWESGVDYEGSSGKVGELMEFIVSNIELEALNLNGISYEIIIEDLEKDYIQKVDRSKIATVSFGNGSMGGFYTFNEVVVQLDSMKTRFPNLITSKQSIGISIEGRNIWAVKISDNPDINEQDEPEVLYTALTHAREPQGMMTIIYYMWWLLENYGIDSEATYLVNNRQMWFIPVVNPDGYAYNAITNPTGGGMWRKNRRINYDGSYGVDLNRNFGPYYMWNAPNGGSSTNPSSDTYRGTAPFSEPETQAIDNFMRTHNIKACFNYHTYSNLLIYPWGYLSQESYDSLLLREWAYDLTAINHYNFGTDIQTVSYSTRGNSDDYMFGDTTKPITRAMTPEVGLSSDGVNNNGFWPRPERIEPLAQVNLQANKLLSYYAGAYPFTKHYELIGSEGKRFIERGKNFSLIIHVRNKGLQTATNLNLWISSSTYRIQFFEDVKVIDSIPSQNTTQVSFLGKCDNNSPTGIPFQVIIRITDNRGFERFDTLNLYIGEPEIIFADSGNSGLSNWNIGAGWGLTSNSYTSPFAFTDSPSGNYTSNANNSLTTINTLNLNGYDFAELKFWTKWAIEPTWDFATVEISTNSGTTWSTLRATLSQGGSGLSGSRQPASDWGYDGYTPGLTWVEESVDLSSYVNKQVKLRFRVQSDGVDQRDGFYIDDIRVLGYRTNIDTMLPSVPILVYPENGISNVPISLTLKWQKASNARTYTIQISKDSSFNIIEYSDSTLKDTFYQVENLKPTVRYYWRVLAENSLGKSEWSTPVWSFVPVQGPVILSYDNRWNLISLPITLINMRKDSVFPNAISEAYTYNSGSYNIHDTLQTGKGYWLNFPNKGVTYLYGTISSKDTIIVEEGWNLIGSLHCPIHISEIVQIPPNNITSNLFKYKQGYISTETIEPGKGFWVKVRQPGILILEQIKQK